MDTQPGTVTALWRYPVKAMLGQRLRTADLTARGLAGDRRLALLDPDSGESVTALLPRLYQTVLGCGAALDEQGGVRITLPDGAGTHSTAPDADAVLSAYLGRPVTLGPAPVPASLFLGAPVHLITTATLERLAAENPRGLAEPERYRPNLLIDTGGDGFAENDWIGRELRVGEKAVLRVVAGTPRCAIPTMAHGTLPRDPEALRVIRRTNAFPAAPGRDPEPIAGVYAEVVRLGPVAEGDPVRL
ncbi:MOSC N-terminal beta barrel domain-containing protein [Streptomyces sp. NPDC052687]|uniref:MOSC domain-containing protein n=1 Tax=Streptomyces sp. NPDC052687 TaxID=3154759 RepID=UPI00342FEC13